MNCTEAQRFLHAYIDNELDVTHTLDIERHLETCAACRETYSRYQEVRDAIKGNSLYYTAPHQLRQKVRASLRQQERASLLTRTPSVWRGLGAVAAACLIVAALAVLLSGLFHGISTSPSGGGTAIQQQVFDSHMRSLMATNPVDIRSSDPSTIKPWFKGKLDYSPYIYDLASNGYSLVGGRMDYLDNRAVAAIVYQYNGHLINFFLWPSNQNTTPVTMSAIRNYHLANWQEQNMNCWAISDTDPHNLQNFAHLLQQR